MALRIQALHVRDSAAIHRIYREAFKQFGMGFSVYISGSAPRYYESLMSHPTLMPSHTILGARIRDRLVGFAHSKAEGTSWHLNCIAILPSYQQRGIGASLFSASSEVGSEKGYRDFTLDVDSRNSKAIQMYERRGFREISATFVYEKRYRQMPSDIWSLNRVEIPDWPNAVAWQTAFGFSEFHVCRGEERWKVGRLATSFFRTKGIPPRWVEQALTRLDSNRKLLIHSEHPLDAKKEGLDLHMKMIRMKGSTAFQDRE
jgi:ribosomal protein S18 acetylase RimI-like enzyme